MSVPSVRATPGHARIPALDGLRGLAILLVLLHHETVMEGASRFDQLWQRFAHFGWCGVNLFFVLSGFLITGILFDSKEQHSYFRNFYARRTLRIFPLYYAVVFVSLVVVPHLVHAKTPDHQIPEFWYWTYMSNFLVARLGHWHHFLDVSWSLAIEEQFYLVWPMVVLLCSRRLLMWICAGMMLAAPIFRFAVVQTGHSFITAYVLTPSHLDSLGIGAWLALTARGPTGLNRLLPTARIAVAGGIVLLAALIAIDWSFDNNGNVVTWCMTLLAIAFGGLLTLAVASTQQSWWVRAISHPFLRIFGKYSYALYLVNLPLRTFLDGKKYSPAKLGLVLGSQIPAQLLFYLVLTCLCLSAAWLSWNLYEVHFLKLKSLFQGTDGRSLG